MLLLRRLHGALGWGVEGRLSLIWEAEAYRGSKLQLKLPLVLCLHNPKELPLCVWRRSMVILKALAGPAAPVLAAARLGMLWKSLEMCWK